MTLYRRKYLCICAGLQEELYLSHLAYLMKDYPRRVVTFNTVIDNPWKLKKFYQDYDKAALFDFDFNDAEFRNNIELCDQINKENKPAGET